MIHAGLAANQWTALADYERGFNDLMQPLQPALSALGATGRLHLGDHGTVYSASTREVEAFLRPLWGLGAFTHAHPDNVYWPQFLAGIQHATDPSDAAYWGDITDNDQLIVEMAALATTILLNTEAVQTQLGSAAVDQLAAWLRQANDHTLPDNNWHFFRVLVNLALKALGQAYSPEMIAADLQRIDDFYVGDGWYFDGNQTQRDYYIAFAMHYYGLLYATFAKADDPKRSAEFIKRATIFAKHYRDWFDAQGEALPFGRSLCYRFAQAAFFSALVFADVEALPWGEIKGLLARNLHTWFSQPIFDNAGVLSVGYHYSDLVFAEGYNGPGSPYWAMKTFILLATPKTHPFWQAPVVPYQAPDGLVVSQAGRALYQHSEQGTHTLSFPAGQFVNNQNHACAKYSKFVYSTRFGNSVPKATYWYYEGAYDNCLALAEDDHDFRSKALDDAYEIQADRVIHDWTPWTDVKIRSTIVPFAGWHLRVHEITTARAIDAYDGGFSAPIEAPYDESALAYQSPVGYVAVANIAGFARGGLVKPEPNTNLLYPRTVLPYLYQHLTPGRHVLVSAITGAKQAVALPVITVDEHRVQVLDKTILLRG
ncbi:DUF2264 domain-containing protein [Lacticaseibacillus jixiensis]|uniref:DUF2264 domain-containing protein n=1 Tax=Lacticaseibacillus jixiensis TaxID=3231926 RepID=UPI0036F29E33